MIKKPKLQMTSIMKHFRFLIGALFLLSIYGCSSSFTYSDFIITQRTRDIRRVGVLPFMNESKRIGAGNIVTNIFIAIIHKTGIFQVEEQGNINQFLDRKRINDIKIMDTKQIESLGEMLDLDAVFIGTVKEFGGGDQGARLSAPVISLQIRLVEARSGKIIWMKNNRITGEDFITVFDKGRVRSVSTLAKIALTDAIDAMF
jgi:hypothetical protein